ncbi:GTP 3',8-cyclase MoaA [Chitinophaga sp. GCM10012297]|uniref:GTP 3',8-cyclase n=1 Tax=Chitinophaga chungangae TaxID=2821488 RepID=A0ABS3Y963_9BACT|nr:GTP 3',8-cyclase MoaA [Chitinophaga chungangae]MBO9151228.1 GTP 3',8-cyclase MoaA [Chitinophaga chungangae]
MLTDQHDRRISYLRLAVTDRCNLRCTYCMPEKMQFLGRASLLTFEEISRLVRLLAAEGIERVRITGGEPFLRKDLLSLLEIIAAHCEVAVTTNGVLTAPFVPALRKMGVKKVNLSLDTLHAERFQRITRRDGFAAVMNTLQTLLEHEMEVKINMVVMNGVNTDELHAFTELTRQNLLSVRFIEEMPFNGQGNGFSGIEWHYRRILSHIGEKFELQKRQDAPGSTALSYRIPGHAGNIGVIPAFSRTFCGTCNRLRVTPTGGVKTCLYGHDAMNVRDLMRDGFSDGSLISAIRSAIAGKHADGFSAERANARKMLESMSAIGG